MRATPANQDVQETTIPVIPRPIFEAHHARLDLISFESLDINLSGIAAANVDRALWKGEVAKQKVKFGKLGQPSDSLVTSFSCEGVDQDWEAPEMK